MRDPEAAVPDSSEEASSEDISSAEEPAPQPRIKQRKAALAPARHSVSPRVSPSLSPPPARPPTQGREA